MCRQHCALDAVYEPATSNATEDQIKAINHLRPGLGDKFQGPVRRIREQFSGGDGNPSKRKRHHREKKPAPPPNPEDPERAEPQRVLETQRLVSVSDLLYHIVAGTPMADHEVTWSDGDAVDMGIEFSCKPFPEQDALTLQQLRHALVQSQQTLQKPVWMEPDDDQGALYNTKPLTVVGPSGLYLILGVWVRHAIYVVLHRPAAGHTHRLHFILSDSICGPVIRLSNGFLPGTSTGRSRHRPPRCK